MAANTKYLKVRQLMLLFTMQKGGEIIVHHNMDKNTHEYELELDGDVIACNKSHVSNFIKRGLIEVACIVNTQNPNTETIKYRICKNIW